MASTKTGFQIVTIRPGSELSSKKSNTRLLELASNQLIDGHSVIQQVLKFQPLKRMTEKKSLLKLSSMT